MEPAKAHYWRWILAAALLACSFQLVWFSLRCIRQIDIDGIDYVGIAHHVRDGQFFSSINGFRSPLISWLIAGVSLFIRNLLFAGKAVSIASFLCCLILLYLFTQKLWHSKLVSSFAALWFVLARGTCVLAVQMVTADFLLTAFTLLYFLALLHCLQRSTTGNWILLGLVHGAAFLAKAFALPWLAVADICAVVAVPARNFKIRMAHLSLAFLFPVLIAGSWAAVLHAKYGFYVTGTQFKTNYLQSTVRAFDHTHEGSYAFLRDTSSEIDKYMVNDPMPPNSWPWRYHISPQRALRPALMAELRNIPRALKEVAILLTPGGILAFLLGLAALGAQRTKYHQEFRLGILIALSAIALVLGYCMLVFDGRYALPIVAVLIAFSSRFFFSSPELPLAQRGRHVAVALFVAGIIFSTVYWASPFRTHARDYQVVCYEAGESLRSHGTGELVSLGIGPFPQYGVGWEAAYKSSYFGGWRLIAASETLPEKDQDAMLVNDLKQAAANAIVVWGNPSDDAYRQTVHLISNNEDIESVQTIRDPVIGETGIIIFLRAQHLTQRYSIQHAPPPRVHRKK